MHRTTKVDLDDYIFSQESSQNNEFGNRYVQSMDANMEQDKPFYENTPFIVRQGSALKVAGLYKLLDFGSLVIYSCLSIIVWHIRDISYRS